ncbi:MAG TPA: hypothetical protein VJN48_05835 [Terriglobales bacterium]|nr:hypothetical protein [Terriglobales bacterium]
MYTIISGASTSSFSTIPSLIAEVTVNQNDNFEKERTVRRSELLLGNHFSGWLRNHCQRTELDLVPAFAKSSSRGEFSPRTGHPTGRAAAN